MLRNKDQKDTYPKPSPALSGDVINLLSKTVSYKDGLVALRQTSRGNNEAVECSDAGKLARYAHDLEPYALRTSLAGLVDRLINKCKMDLRIMNLGTLCTGPAAGIALGTAVYGIPGAYI